jgi:hypothetical protein
MKINFFLSKKNIFPIFLESLHINLLVLAHQLCWVWVAPILKKSLAIGYTTLL